MAFAYTLRNGVEELAANPLRSALQLSGIALGVASIVTALAIVAGERENDIRQVEKRGGLTRIDVRPLQAGWQDALYATDSPFDLRDLAAVHAHLGDRLSALNASVSAAGRLESGRVERDIPALGVLPEYERFNDFYASEGRFLTWSDVDEAAPVCILGDTLRHELFGPGDAVGRRVRFEGQALTIVGVMERKELKFLGNHNALEWMNKLLLVPLSAVQKRFTGSPYIATFQVMARAPEDVTGVKDDLRLLLRRRHHGREDFELIVRQDQFERTQRIKLVYNLFFVGIVAISLAVAGIVIMNILLASLSTRVREIGVRKAIGAQSADVFFQFLTESITVALAGAVIGILLGTIGAQIVARIVDLHASVPLWILAVAIFMAMGTGVAFGLYPAWRASRVPPVEALRYE